MIKKLSLLAASLTAALVIAGGFALAGFGPATVGDQPQLVNDAAPVAPVSTADAAPQEAPVQIDTVYLTPQETPKSVTVTKVRVTKATHHDDDGENEHEGGDDD
jgi:hypothetical protein